MGCVYVYVVCVCVVCVWGVCVCVCVCVLPVSRDFCKEEKLFWPYMTGVQEVWGLFPSWLLTGFLTVGK